MKVSGLFEDNVPSLEQSLSTMGSASPRTSPLSEEHKRLNEGAPLPPKPPLGTPPSGRRNSRNPKRLESVIEKAARRMPTGMSKDEIDQGQSPSNTRSASAERRRKSKRRSEGESNSLTATSETVNTGYLDLPLTVIVGHPPSERDVNGRGDQLKEELGKLSLEEHRKYISQMMKSLAGGTGDTTEAKKPSIIPSSSVSKKKQPESPRSLSSSDRQRSRGKDLTFQEHQNYSDRMKDSSSRTPPPPSNQTVSPFMKTEARSERRLSFSGEKSSGSHSTGKSGNSSVVSPSRDSENTGESNNGGNSRSSSKTPRANQRSSRDEKETHKIQKNEKNESYFIPLSCSAEQKSTRGPGAFNKEGAREEIHKIKSQRRLSSGDDTNKGTKSNTPLMKDSMRKVKSERHLTTTWVGTNRDKLGRRSSPTKAMKKAVTERHLSDLCEAKTPGPARRGTSQSPKSFRRRSSSRGSRDRRSRSIDRKSQNKEGVVSPKDMPHQKRSSSSDARRQRSRSRGTKDRRSRSLARRSQKPDGDSQVNEMPLSRLNTQRNSRNSKSSVESQNKRNGKPSCITPGPTAIMSPTGSGQDYLRSSSNPKQRRTRSMAPSQERRASNSLDSTRRQHSSSSRQRRKETISPELAGQVRLLPVQSNELELRELLESGVDDRAQVLLKNGNKVHGMIKPKSTGSLKSSTSGSRSSPRKSSRRGSSLFSKFEYLLKSPQKQRELTSNSAHVYSQKSPRSLNISSSLHSEGANTPRSSRRSISTIGQPNSKPGRRGRKSGHILESMNNQSLEPVQNVTADSELGRRPRQRSSEKRNRSGSRSTQGGMSTRRRRETDKTIVVIQKWVRRFLAPLSPRKLMDRQTHSSVVLQKYVRRLLAQFAHEEAKRRREHERKKEFLKYVKQKAAYKEYAENKRFEKWADKRELATIEKKLSSIQHDKELELEKLQERLEIQKEVWGEVIRKKVDEEQKVHDEKMKALEGLSEEGTPEMTADIEEENNEIKAWLEKMEAKVAVKKEEQKAVEEANVQVETMFNTVNAFTKTKVAEKKNLSSQQLTMTNVLIPKAEKNAEAATHEAKVETRSGLLHRKQLYKILNGLQESDAYDHVLFQEVQTAIQQCEIELEKPVLEGEKLDRFIECDIDTFIEKGASALLGPSLLNQQYLTYPAMSADNSSELGSVS